MEGMDGRRFQGRAAIAGFCQEFIGGPQFRGTQHFNDHLRIDGDGRQCAVRSYWMSVRWDPDSDQRYIKNMGHYHSRCLKLDDTWYFRERLFASGLVTRRRGPAACRPTVSRELAIATIYARFIRSSVSATFVVSGIVRMATKATTDDRHRKIDSARLPLLPAASRAAIDGVCAPMIDDSEVHTPIAV